MDSNLYRLVYCSHNRIHGTPAQVEAEIQNILASSRANNPRLGLTGALLYNSGSFAQVLEGPLPSVDRIFETIQCDERHGESTVIESGPVDTREFPDWSMAFASNDACTPVATVAFDAAFAKSAGAGGQILSLLKDLVKREDN